MVRFIVQQKVHRPEQLQAFTGESMSTLYSGPFAVFYVYTGALPKQYS